MPNTGTEQDVSVVLHVAAGAATATFCLHYLSANS
jgi:hypothetical protein